MGVDPKRYTPAAIHNQISAAKNRLRAASDYREAVGSPFEEMVADVYEIYERDLHRMNAMDFDDLLFRTVNLLELFPEVRERYSATFRHVLVDEYQDTNYAQYRLLQLLVGGGRQEPERGGRTSIPGHRNLAVVGDDSQSIYSFRGAEVRNILDFQDDFPDARVVKLEQNYRSTETILSAANAVIANNRGGIAKRLWSELGEGEQIHLRALDDEHAEARFVVGEIERLLDEGAARSEIAVLYRTNAMSRVLEDTLVRREIAYQVIGGTKFYERAEIKDAIAYLSLLANPFDVVSFTRIANSPRRGLGQTSLARVLAHAAAMDISVWQAACAPEEVPGLGAAAIKALHRFMGTMGELRVLAGLPAEVAERGADEAAERARGRCRSPRAARGGAVADRLHRGAGGRADDRGAGAPREPRAAGRGGPRVRRRGLRRGRTRSTSSCRRSRWSPTPTARSEDEGLVTLMTLHNAKGLEYPIVFIAGCEDGVFPHSRAHRRGRARGGAASVLRGRDARDARAVPDLRARRAVFGAQTSGMRSRFLDEIPSDLLDEPQESVRWGAGQRMGPIHAGVGRQGSGKGGRRCALPRAGAWARPPVAERRDGGRISPGRGRRARGLRRGRRHRRRARWRDRRALRRRWLRAQADGRVRAGQPSLTLAGDPCPQPSSIRSVSARIIDGKAIAARVRGGVAHDVEAFVRPR